MNPRALLSSALMLVALAPYAAAQPPQVPPEHAEQMAKGLDVFKKHVRGILVERCLKCHGGEKTRGSFDLSTREALLEGGDNGSAIVPGKAKQSRLYKLITHADMPHMPAKEPKLPDAEIAHIATWIDLGAPYDKPLLEKKIAAGKQPMVVTDADRQFWSFRPLSCPQLPVVKDGGWCRLPLDRFILTKLEAKGIRPNPEANRRTLIRRAYFDVVGLPPPADEVERFVNDPAPDAYEKLIDKLLDSPHYGEKWARHWLDLARFAESSGYEHDYDRPHAYHYRDFVIKALNSGLPYDTFVKWQIAGDEYAPDNALAMTATGFLAAGTHSTQTTISLVEKERYEQLDDKLRTLGTAFLGLTVGCARCHDHKYDPIPTRDYYRMLSTFTTTVKSNVDLDLDPEGYKQAKAKHDAERERLLEPVRRFEREQLAARMRQWIESRRKETYDWVLPDTVKATSAGGATLTLQDDGSFLASGKSPDTDTYTFTIHTGLTGITGLRLEALAHPSLVKHGPGRADNGNFALTDVRVTAAPRKDKKAAVPVKLTAARATFEQKGLPVSAAIDGDKKSGWAVDPQFGKDHAAALDFASRVGFEGGTVLTVTLEFKNNKKHSIGRPRLSLSTVARPALASEATPEVALDPPQDPSSPRWQSLLKWYRTRDAEWQALMKPVSDHDRSAPKPSVVKALIASEGVPPLRMHSQGADFFDKTYFLKRGDTDQKDGEAPQGFLQVLMRDAPEQEKRWQTGPPAGSKTSYRRRALAEWITDVERGAGNLLARVIVNRLWQQHLGRGIVATPSDFGFQGERPSHSELLDHLAGELIRNGWRLKPIHKLIMTSAVYRQTADRDPAKVKADPDNTLFWHRPRQRLQAELIRDAMLSVSGELDARMFGPGTLDTKHKRRSIYFFVKRSKLVPMMVLFDAPDALGGMERRPVTTVAPQALLMLNSEAVRGHAEALARRLDPNGDAPPADVVSAAYRAALGRGPTREELSDSVEFLRDQTESYRTDGQPEPRRTAIADFCQALMGLNEFVYVD